MEQGYLQGYLLHPHPSHKYIFSPGSSSSILWAHALCKSLPCFYHRPLLAHGAGFWSAGFGERGWVRLARGALHCVGGCQRVMLYPGTGELRERRVGVLAAVPAAQLPQGLQAGCPAAQALLASDSVQQTETGQRVTDGSAPAPGSVALGTVMRMVGGRGLHVRGKSHPQQSLGTGICFQHMLKGFGCTGHCQPVRCVCVLVFSMEVWCLMVCLRQEK